MEPARIEAVIQINIIVWIKFIKRRMALYKITPDTLFNLDETSLRLSDSLSTHCVHFVNLPTAIVKKGKRVENATLLYTAVADGTRLCAHILYPKKKEAQEFATLKHCRVVVHYGTNGWMTTDMFQKILVEHIFPEMNARRGSTKQKAKLMLLLDGHSSRNDHEIQISAEKNNERLLFKIRSDYSLWISNKFVFCPEKSAPCVGRSRNNHFIWHQKFGEEGSEPLTYPGDENVDENDPTATHRADQLSFDPGSKPPPTQVNDHTIRPFKRNQSTRSETGRESSEPKKAPRLKQTTLPLLFGTPPDQRRAKLFIVKEDDDEIDL
ncbi:hypothetical protein BLNAU_2051 [Blattamonas nauphoetae]|uniref:DDE-1 domain-containing protein n=1 Tax=Blattamonas nauphoetae TaxID=2049346 RepID=A0ABQ9YGZ1_9EUKA|nr:hypothetical protein BLNAU_2051 [Blattamonas nauphoetae]